MKEDTVEDLKKDIKDSENAITAQKEINKPWLTELREEVNSQNYDLNYYLKAEREMDYRIKCGTENGSYQEPEHPKPEPPAPKEYKKKSKWTILKENFKKVIM